MDYLNFEYFAAAAWAIPWAMASLGLLIAWCVVWNNPIPKSYTSNLVWVTLTIVHKLS